MVRDKDRDGFEGGAVFGVELEIWTLKGVLTMRKLIKNYLIRRDLRRLDWIRAMRGRGW